MNPIPVTERLPESSHKVLAFYTYHERWRIAYWHEERDSWVFDDGSLPGASEISHWLPLPEDPT